MAEGKKSFVLYADILHMVRKLPQEQQAELFLTILEYVNDENPEPENILVQVAFEPIKRKLKEDLVKWEKSKDEKSRHAMIGNLKRWHPDLFKLYKSGKKSLEYCVNVMENRKSSGSDRGRSNTIESVAVNVNDSVNVNVIKPSKEGVNNARAMTFLKSNYQSRFEQEFQMRYSKQILNLEKFIEDFNDTVDQENLEYTDKILFARLGKYSRNWIENQNRYSQTPPEDSWESGKLPRR